MLYVLLSWNTVRVALTDKREGSFSRAERRALRAYTDSEMW